MSVLALAPDVRSRGFPTSRNYFLLGRRGVAHEQGFTHDQEQPEHSEQTELPSTWVAQGAQIARIAC